MNFSYFEAGENKQALVKLVTCERCAEKLNYKKRKEEQSAKREKEEHKRKRERVSSDDDTENEHKQSKERRKGKKASTSARDPKTEDDETFDEFLEGMFP